MKWLDLLEHSERLDVYIWKGGILIAKPAVLNVAYEA